LAILKTGGAYLPLDPAYPDERIAHMLEDSGARLVVTTSELAGRVTAGDVCTISLDSAAAEIARHPAHAPPPHGRSGGGNGADAVAYVIYTSGSTGRPKGVQVTHANVGRLFDATAGWFEFSPRDVWTLFHSYAFDFSVWEI